MNNLSWKNFKKNFRSYLPAILILAFGIALINAVLKIQKQLDDQLHNNVAGIQTIVGAKGSPIQLVLANVYHMDDPTGNIPLEEAEKLYNNPMVSKALPLAYGDNHKGYKILGTDIDYVEHFGGKLKSGKHIEKPFEVILGHDVAQTLGVGIGYTFHSVHGSGHQGHVHAENTYRVVGTLDKTNKAIDKLIITSVASLWASHDVHNLENVFDRHSFIKAKELNKKLNDHHVHTESCNHDHEEHEDHHHKGHSHHTEEHAHDHTHTDTVEKPNHHDTNDKATAEQRDITALLLSFKGSAGFMMLNQINQSEKIMAVNPAQVILKFFTVLGVGYTTIQSIAWSVLGISIVTLMLTLIQVFSSRKYELALLRVMGASKGKLLKTLLGEVLLIVFSGFILGTLFTIIGIQLLANNLQQNLFDGFDWSTFGRNEPFILLVCIFCGMVSVIIPLIKVYNIDISKTLSDEN